ncbi:MAG: hypothetical protein ACJAUV_001495 [Flavobacteriales bacterium]|jgi:hypothetical protein
MYKAGSIFRFDYEHDGIIEKGHHFMLVNTHESGFLFQVTIKEL